MYETRTAAAELFDFSYSARCILAPGTTASLNLLLRGTLKEGGVAEVLRLNVEQALVRTVDFFIYSTLLPISPGVL